MPDKVYMNNFFDEELEAILVAQGFEITSNLKDASYIIFEEDPNRKMYRLPPRTAFMIRDDFVKTLGRSLAKKGWV
jgi:hypothetical protein